MVIILYFLFNYWHLQKLLNPVGVTKTPLRASQRGFSYIFVPKLSQRISDDDFGTIPYPENDTPADFSTEGVVLLHIYWLGHRISG